LNIIPKKSLVKNIGIGEDYTNTRPNFIDKKFLEVNSNKLGFPLKIPNKMKSDKMFRIKSVAKDWLRIVLKRTLLPFI